jgi:hypothetical protein
MLRQWMIAAFAIALLASHSARDTAAAQTAPTHTPSPTAAATKEQRALEAGVQAVVYGMPLVLMDLTMKSFVDSPERPVAINQFAHLRTYPSATFKTVVRANVDTLYSTAFLDLSEEPIVLSVPDTRGRYYLMPMMDAWTNVFASPGKRTTGTAAGNFAITGPGWSGTLPPGVKELKSPTNLVWILGRTQTNGPADYAAVHAIQDGYKLVPLSSFGRPYTPPARVVDPSVDTRTPPVEQLQQMSASTFFNALARLLKTNPPPSSEAPILAKLATIGVVPGQAWDASKLDPDVAKGLSQSVAVALKQLQGRTGNTSGLINGWKILPMNVGNFGSDYGLRALIALIAFGANLPADAIYPTTYFGGDGKSLSGANRYTLHFDKGQTPPVNAFWSVTMYDAQSFFVANSIDRYAISSWMPLKQNPDGSIDIYIQHDAPPAAMQANWLPAPAGDFNLTLRMYWPDVNRLATGGGTWKPPVVTRVAP